MKIPNITVLIAALLAVGVACKRQSAKPTQHVSGVVTFSEAGVTLEPATGWEPIDLSGMSQTTDEYNACPPTLVSQSGIIEVLLLASKYTDLDMVAARFRAAFEAYPTAQRNSYLQQEIETPSGLRGLRISYSQELANAGRMTSGRHYYFIVKNADKRCVAVKYVVETDHYTNAVIQMIERTLKLK